jgi:uncharacterized protein (DUF1800 family)
MYSEKERIAHVVRRLGMGPNTRIVDETKSVDDAIARMLDMPVFPVDAPKVKPPKTWDDVDYELLSTTLVPWWLSQMASGDQPLLERLIWFWHDHLAVSAEKVSHPYVVWQHHRLVRSLAAGSFADLLRATSKDAAMLWYLDGAANAIDAPNENFGREVMELHTMGIGTYTQDDVTEIARAFTGWTVNEPHWERAGFVYDHEDPWSGVFDPTLFDGGEKTFLGVTGAYGMDEALDLLLDRPETGRHVGSALYRELVGLEPPPATVRRLGTIFAANYDTMRLVEEIVSDPVFTSDEAIRAKVRTPVEKAVAVLQGLPPSPDASGDWMFWILEKLSYLPLHPPNPAGFPPGLLDPARLLGSFELLNLAANLDEEGAEAVDVLAVLGLYDVSAETMALLGRFPRPGLQLGLAFGSPEFLVV